MKAFPFLKRRATDKEMNLLTFVSSESWTLGGKKCPSNYNPRLFIALLILWL